MRTSVRQSGIFLFNIIPIYRPGMSRVFDYSRHRYNAASLPSSAQRIKQNTLFSGLEDQCGACLSDLDLLYVFATDGDRDYAKINWKSPGDFDATEPVAPTFTANEGFQGNGSSQYLTTGWDPTTDGVNFTQNEGGWLIHVNNNTSSNRRCFGASDASFDGQTALVPKNLINGNCQYSINSLLDTGISLSTTIGFYHCVRTESNVLDLYINGSLVDQSTAQTNGFTSVDIEICSFNINGLREFSPYQISIFGIGASLTGKESALYTAWNNYFTSL